VARLHLRQLRAFIFYPRASSHRPGIRRLRTCPRRADMYRATCDARCFRRRRIPGSFTLARPYKMLHGPTVHISQLKRYRVLGARKTGPLRDKRSGVALAVMVLDDS